MNITWVTLVINALIALLSAGGVGWIITAKEDKKAKMLENKQKEQEIEEHKKDEIIKDGSLVLIDCGLFKCLLLFRFDGIVVV